MLVRKSAQWTVSFVSVFPGRVLAGILQLDEGWVVVIGCHLTRHLDYTWHEVAGTMAQWVHSFKAEHSPSLVLIAGDFNFPDVTTELDANHPMGVHHNALRRRWRALFPEMVSVSPGPSHYHAATLALTELDRFYSDLALPLMEQLRPYAHIIGYANRPPAGSDHWPIGLQWPARSPADGSLSRWVAKLEGWPAKLAPRVLAMDDQYAHWSVRWTRLKAVIEDVAAECLQELRGREPRGPIEQLIFLKRLLSLLEGGMSSQALSMRRLAPSLRLPAGLSELSDVVPEKIKSLESQLLQDDLSAAEFPEQFEAVQADWHMRILTAWTRSTSSPLSSAVSGEHGVAHSPAQEVALLNEYWSGVFQTPDEVDTSVWQPLLKRTPSIPWPSVLPSVDAIQEYLLNVPDRAPGPDEITYGHMRPIAGVIADLLLGFIQDLAAGASVPTSLFDSTFIFIPKSELAAIPPDGWRPISLGNCFAKAAMALLFRPAIDSMPTWAVPSQHGFCKGRAAEDAVAVVEYYALQSWSWNGASLFAADLRQAFPSLSRSWAKAALQASGAPRWLLLAAERWLQSSYGYVRWRGQMFPGFLIKSGLLQGLPGSPPWFVLCLDGWLRYASLALGTKGILQAFVDDTLTVIMGAQAIVALPPLYRVLQRATGLALCKAKCKLLPLGKTEDFESHYSADFWVDVVKVEELEYLGFSLARGVYMDIGKKALRKLTRKLPMLAELQLGTPGAIHVARVCLLSCLTHILRVSIPTRELAQCWQRIEGRTAWGLRSFLGPIIHHLRAVFRLPVKVPDLKVVALQMRASAIQRQQFDPRKVWQEMSAQMENAPLLHPCHGWKTHSIWKAWTLTCEELVGQGLLSPDLKLRDQWRLRIVKNLLPSPCQLRQQFLYQVSSQANVLARITGPHRFAAGALWHIRALASKAPARAVAILRVLLQPMHSKHVHPGSCCYCHGHHGPGFSFLLNCSGLIRVWQHRSLRKVRVLTNLALIRLIADDRSLRLAWQLGLACKLLLAMRLDCMHS